MGHSEPECPIVGQTRVRVKFKRRPLKADGYAMAKEVSDKAEPVTSAAKAAEGWQTFIAALKRCATQNQLLSAADKAMA